MADEITIGGKKFPKWGVYASVAGGIGIVGYVYYKHKQNANAAASSTANSGIDPVTGLPYSEDNQVDPVTGMTYLEEAEEYGSVAAAESAVESQNEAGAYDYSDLYGNDTGLEELTGANGTETGTSYTSNAEWAQAATVGLEDLGYSSTDIAAALGNYLAGLPLTSGQEEIVYAALAEYGDPPTPVPAITLASQTTTSSTGNTTTTSTGSTSTGSTSTGSTSTGTGTTSTSTGTSTATVTVPNVVGDDISEAGSAIQALGLSYSGPSPVSGQVVWVTSQSPAAGSQVAPGTLVTVQGSVSGSPAASNTAVVPNVVGLPIDQAGPKITAAGFVYDGPSPVAGKVVTITSETPAGGSTQPKGITVRCTGKTS